MEKGQAEARKNRFKRMAVTEVDDDGVEEVRSNAAKKGAPGKQFKRIVKYDQVIFYDTKC